MSLIPLTVMGSFKVWLFFKIFMCLEIIPFLSITNKLNKGNIYKAYILTCMKPLETNKKLSVLFCRDVSSYFYLHSVTVNLIKVFHIWRLC